MYVMTLDSQILEEIELVDDLGLRFFFLLNQYYDETTLFYLSISVMVMMGSNTKIHFLHAI